MSRSDRITPAGYCSALGELAKKYGKPVRTHSEGGAQNIITALEEFMECVRYLNTRRAAGTILALDDEAAVQDAIYLMLRPWITDLVAEDPSGRIGNRFTIKDFISKALRTVIEAKYVRDRDHGKHITRELHDDIESYRHNQYCDDLIFFVFDPDNHIPDVQALKAAIHARREYDGRILRVRLIVRP